MNKKIIRIIAVFMSLILILLLLPSCGIVISNTSDKKEEAEKIKAIDKLIEESPLQYPAKNDLFCYNVYEGYVGITKYIGDSAEVVIPEKIEDLPVYTIKESAFEGASVTKVVISDGLVQIGENCFADCALLESVSLGKTIRRIGEYAFARCAALTQITIPAGVSTIPSDMCYECTSLKTVRILAENEESIVDSSAFGECTSLEHVYISGFVNEIYSDAFEGVPETVVFHGPKACAAAEYSAEYFFSYQVVEESIDDSDDQDASEQLPETPGDNNKVETEGDPSDAETENPSEQVQGALNAGAVVKIVGLVVLIVAVIVGLIIFVIKWRNRY